MEQVILGDCLEEIKKLPENSIDAIVTDPPYGLSFMGKKWDYDVPKTEIWKECLRVLKPGGYLLSFAGTRTQHRMAVNIEDAGFEIRDMIAWVYGSGFPKSLNIGKAVDKLQGNEREVVGEGKYFNRQPNGLQGATVTNFKDSIGEKYGSNGIETKGTSEWEGWGTALKPALEPITVARKPLEGTVAENCLKWGVGGINIDGCRVEMPDRAAYEAKQRTFKGATGKVGRNSWKNSSPLNDPEISIENSKLGRFPANLIHDGSDEVVSLFPNTKSGSGVKKRATGSAEGIFNINKIEGDYLQGDSGSASRFFYCAKASKSERNKGCDGLEEKQTIYAEGSNLHKNGDGSPRNKLPTLKNNHPTVKPIALMEYLIKLVSREGQIILDPFAGSCSTAVAAKKLKRNYIMIERESDYLKICEARIAAVKKEKATLPLPQ